MEYLQDTDTHKELKSFIKKFVKLKLKKAKELKEKVIALDFMQINETHLCKIVDLLPENKEELNKILIDVNLNEDETKKILESIKEFR